MAALNPSLLDSQDRNGWTPLHEAARHGNVEIVRFLLNHGADLNKVTSSGKTAHQIAEEFLPPDSDVISYLTELIQSSSSSDYGRTKLHLAVIDNKFEEVVRLSNAHPEMINSEDFNGWTPLHEAARSGNKPIIEFLMSFGADQHKKTVNGKTPYHIAKDHLHNYQLYSEIFHLLDLSAKQSLNTIQESNDIEEITEIEDVHVSPDSNQIYETNEINEIENILETEHSNDIEETTEFENVDVSADSNEIENEETQNEETLNEEIENEETEHSNEIEDVIEIENSDETEHPNETEEIPEIENEDKTTDSNESEEINETEDKEKEECNHGIEEEEKQEDSKPSREAERLDPEVENDKLNKDSDGTIKKENDGILGKILRSFFF